MEHHPTQSLGVEIRAGSREDVSIITLHGPVTIHNFFEFQDLIRKQPSPRVLLIDLTDVPYIDSAALGTLVGIHVSCDKSGRKYALVNPNERLKRLFEMAKVDQLLVTFSSVGEAEHRLS